MKRAPAIISPFKATFFLWLCTLGLDMTIEDSMHGIVKLLRYETDGDSASQKD